MLGVTEEEIGTQTCTEAWPCGNTGDTCESGEEASEGPALLTFEHGLQPQPQTICLCCLTHLVFCFGNPGQLRYHVYLEDFQQSLTCT
jgi:hypothetical protein